MVRTYSFRAVAYSGNARKLELQVRGTPQIDGSEDSEIRTSMQIEIRPEPEFDYLHDEIRLFQIINGRETPAGAFIPVVRTQLRDLSGSHDRLECYDRAYLLQQTRTEGILHLSAGETYLNAIEQLLLAAGVTMYVAEPTSAVLATDREDWQVGTSYLTVVDQLLSEINYAPISFDNSGVALLQPRQETSAAAIRHVITEGAGSTLVPQIERETDLYGKPNVVVAICQNADLPEPLVATAENDNPASSLSILARGRRIAEIVYVDNVADQDALNAYAQRMIYEAMTASETVTVQTAALEDLRVGDVAALRYGAVEGIYQVAGFSMPLGVGQQTTLTLRRKVLA